MCCTSNNRYEKDDFITAAQTASNELKDKSNSILDY
jgi:hypothetical protein